MKIIADSTCDLSEELKEKYDISILPLYVRLGEEEYKDGINISPEELYKWSDENKLTPQTAAPSIEDAIEIMRPYAKGGEKETEIMIFTISSDMSTSFNVAHLAAAELEWEEHVSVIDSRNLSTGIGLLIVKAAEMAKKGIKREEIEKEIKELIPLVRASFVVDTLEYLYRGGRCSATAKLFGTMLKLKPEIVVKDGKMDVGRKYRGRIEHVIMNYVKDLEPALKEAQKDRVFVTHSGCNTEIVEAVCKQVKELGIFNEILVTRAGGVISSHCGPGTLGVLFIASKQE